MQAFVSRFLNRTALSTALALCAAGGLAPVQAAGLSASSASESIGTSIGSLSTSVQQSSASSTGDKRVAAGEYRLIELAAAPGRPGQLRLTLQAKAESAGAAAETPADTFHLFLPQAALNAARLQPGDSIQARAKPYGLEFVEVRSQQAFFLVLEDEIYRELPSRPLSL
ncbi:MULTISPECIES: hypothetical protein [Roseateles]|uniref:hypothetical protein n=1 Tax=Roseateles TaxID=93681 RepID=UPI0014950D10|nr:MULTISPECIES: hypothetical protein [Roseateles]WIV96802.1 hypothetical protein K9V56_017455 [Paucibacter aquatile]